MLYFLNAMWRYDFTVAIGFNFELNMESSQKVKKNNILALSMMFILISPIFALSSFSSFSLSSYKQSAFAQPTQQNIPLKISPELTVTINSGNKPGTDNFNLTNGYKIEPILWNLTLPSTVDLDEKGNIYIAESGYAPGGLETFPRIFKVDPNGTVSTLVDRVLYPPITDIQYEGGVLYVSNRGKITAVDASSGAALDLIMGLRNHGDYRTNQITFGPDGRMYFGQGAATNSGIIGLDNYEWFRIMPSYYGIVPFYDMPGQNITLTGQNFDSSNMFTPVDPSDSATTGAFVPYGNVTSAGQNISGDQRCTACIMSANSDGTDLKVVAWGLRNPYGLAFDSNNRLIVSVDGADERGSRPIANDEDKVYSIDVLNSTSSNSSSSKFYGWPDYFGNGEPVTSGKFQSNSSTQPLQFLMQNHPPVEKPLALVGHNATVTQMAMSNNSNFGFKGNMFIGEFGSIWYSTFGSIGVPSPTASTPEQQPQASQQEALASNATTTATTTNMTAANNNTAALGGNTTTNGTNNSSANTTAATVNNTGITNTNNQTAGIVGQKVIVFNSTSGNYSNFLSLKNPDPSFHPVDVEFSHDGSTLYVLSVGKVEMRKTTPQGHELPAPMPWFHQNTGVLWRITNTTTVEAGPPAESEIKLKEIQLTPDLKKTINSGSPPDTNYLDIPEGYNIQPILWDVDKPGSMAFDNKGNMYFASVGVTYGKQSTTPAIYKVDANGTVSLFMDRPLHGILADIEFNKENGKMYIANRNLLSAIDIETRAMQDLVIGIPTSPFVTHPMGQIAFGPDGRVYFGVGGLSNTAVPDISDYGIGFIAEMPFMHEVPPYNITLEGINFQSGNFLTAENDLATTGGFRPFGVPAYEGQIIEGHPLCTSCIWSINPNGSDFKIEGWGARNPYGMAFDDKGRLFWSNNGNDDKGIRRVTADVDTVSVLDESQDNISFFGWPDIIGMGEPITLEKFNQSPAQNYTNVPLIRDPPPVTIPLVNLGGAVAASQLAYSTSDEFGFKDHMFLAEFGTSAPVQHIHQIPKERSPGSVMGQMLGQRVVVIDTESGNFGDFISLNAPESSFRPVGLQFSPDGSALYIASIEDHVIRKITPTGAILGSHAEWPYAVTGVIYKVWKEDSSPSSPAQEQTSTTAAIGEMNQANSTTNSTVPRREGGQ